MIHALLVLAATQTLTGSVKNVVVVVSDGVRIQEIFEGGDKALMGARGGVENEAGCVAKFWRPDPLRRRAHLMPFLWNTVVTRGQLFGDPARSAPARVTNTARLSYPGYNELFTGVADPRITTNDWVDNPNVTVFEWLSQRPGFERSVQAWATWETFLPIFNVRRSGLEVHAGWHPPFERDPERTAGKDVVDLLHRTTTPLFGGNALDAITWAGLKESLKTSRPRVLFLGLGETDEWMHAGRYDLALEALTRADATIAELWETLQSLPEYRDSTALIVTTDHGRGSGRSDWRHHGASVDGAQDIWIAVMGPGIPALGHRAGTGLVTQGQVASTIATLLGEDYRHDVPNAAPPLPLWPVMGAGLAAGR